MEDAIERFKNRRKLRLDIKAFYDRRSARMDFADGNREVDNLEKRGIINEDAEWHEPDHPRDKDGKFSSKEGASSGASEKSEHSHEKHSHHHGKHENGLAISGDEALKLYNRLKSGDYLPKEELLNHPVVKKMDAIAKHYKEKYGSTSDIHTPERRKLRRDVRHKLLGTGSVVMKEIDGEKQPVYEGPLKKEHKACIVIGLPASGKSSTIVEPYSAENGAFVLDSDRVKEELPEFKKTHGAAASCVHTESQNIHTKMLEHFLKDGDMNGTNVVIPIVGGYYDSVKSFIDQLEDSGYDVELKLKEADPVEAGNRNIMRGIKTGRIIPSGRAFNNADPKLVYDKIKTMKGRNGKPYVRE